MNAKSELSRTGSNSSLRLRLPDNWKHPCPLHCNTPWLLHRKKVPQCWLTALPITELAFTLHKGAFCDTLCLRYRWLLSRLSERCECGHQFTVKHALSCSKGGFLSLWHNEIRDITATLSSEVCNNVAVEPHLQPLAGEQLSRLCTSRCAMNSLWAGRCKKTFLDIRVFNPFSPSNRHSNLSTIYNISTPLRPNCLYRLHYI